MSLSEALNFRRSVRAYTDEQIDPEVVKECLEMAQLAPTSSNMQLYELVHITDPATITALGDACLGQPAMTTANQAVVFVTRQDLHRRHAAQVLEFEQGNIQRNSPPERQASRIKNRKVYYGVLMPLIYTRGFGIPGLLRALLTRVISLFRPIITDVSEPTIRTVTHKSLALAAQTFMLAMAEKGLDTCPMEGFDQCRVARLLQLPRSAQVSMVISCGYRDGDKGIWGERYRLPFDQVYRRI